MKYNWNKQNLIDTVLKAKCWMDWLRLLEIPGRGCNYRTLKRKAILYNIDTSHFDSVYVKTHKSQRILKNRPDEEIFNSNKPIKTASVKKEYINRILKNPKCEICGITNWNGKEIIFQLHHKDGNHKNNNLDNLILLCPNCHSQTDNYANKKCPVV